MVDAPGTLPAGTEPGFLFSQQRQARIARCKRALVRYRWRSLPPHPMLTSIGSRKHGHATVHRIAQHNAAPRVPKRNAVQKTLRIRIGKQQRPVRAAVVRFVNPGFVAGPAAHQNRGSVVEGTHSAKIEIRGV
jgi:hypothetical protein